MLLDENRINELCSLYYRDIYRYCLYYIDDPTDAQDIAQETFKSLLESSEKLEDYYMRAWLYDVAYKKSKHFLRDNQKEQNRIAFGNNIDSAECASTYSLDDELEKAEFPPEVIEKKADEIIDKLSEKDRKLFEDVYIQRKKYKQIAKEADSTEKAVGVRVLRLRKKITKFARIALKSFFLFFSFF